MKKFLSLLLALLLLFSLSSCADTGGYEEEHLIYGPDYESFADYESIAQPDAEIPGDLSDETEAPTQSPIDEDGWYYSAEDVALYLHTYGKLPGNYMTKSEARDLGWTGGTVENYAEGRAIGGDRFYNREGLLPEADGRKYYECDIDTKGRGSRGARRIVFSNDGLIYYTEDHYESFTLLYGEE